MINELIKLATHLDKKGLHKEANYIDAVIKKNAEAPIKNVRIKNVWNTVVVGTFQYGRTPQAFVPNDTGKNLKEKQAELGIIWRGENLIGQDTIPDYTEIIK